MTSRHQLPGAPSCPHCSRLLDGVTAANGGDALPKDGDRTICLYCMRLAVFVVGPMGFALRAVTSEEDEEFRANHPDSLAYARQMHDLLRARYS